jgi:two-component system, LuxR family, sensor kinase FixL
LIDSLKNLSFLALLDASADAMLLIDKNGHIVKANPPSLQLFEYEENEIIGLGVDDLVPNANRSQHQHHRSNYFDNPEKRSMGKGKNLVAVTRNGKEVAVNIGLSPIHNEGKTFVLATFYALDQRKYGEELLAVSEERLRLAKLVAGFGVADVDLKHNQVQCDARVREFWGFLADEVISYDRFCEAIHPQDRPLRQATIDEAIQGSKREYRSEYRVINLKNNSLHWVLCAGKAFCHDGHAVRLLGAVLDITEQKLLEQRLNTQRIEMENLAKQQIALQTVSAIAHELNQPLAAISAYSEVALHELDADVINKAILNRSLVGCVEQSQRAGKSLHELLKFMQTSEAAIEQVDLNEMIQESLNITQNSSYGGFKATLYLEHDLPKVLINPTQLQKVIVNLLRNGIEAVHGTGVPIADIQVTVRTLKDSNMAQVTIQDNGPGLSEEVTKRIFEPFFTTKPQGIGMGLSISRALVEASGGQLWFDPNSKTGAIFHFTLPLVKS